MDNLSKITTKTWYACRKCEKKMESISIGGNTGIFDFSTKSAMWCENKECERFGDLTVVGIKKEE